jgi:hypothetical protein
MEVPHVQEPSPEQVDAALQHFIASMQGMFERHKEACGHKDLQLRVL